MAGPVVDTDGARTPFGINLGAGVGVIITSVVVAPVLFPDTLGRLLVVALAAGGFAAVVDDIRAGVAVGGLGYLLLDGFLVNQYGELTWDGTTSMWYLMVFALAMVLGSGWRWFRSLRAGAVIDAALDDLLNHINVNSKESHGARSGVRAVDGRPVRGARPGGAGGGAAVSTPRRRLLRSRFRGDSA